MLRQRITADPQAYRYREVRPDRSPSRARRAPDDQAKTAPAPRDIPFEQLVPPSQAEAIQDAHRDRHTAESPPGLVASATSLEAPQASPHSPPDDPPAEARCMP